MNVGVVARGFQPRRSTVTRAGRQGLSRNAAIALGNRGAPGDAEALAECLARDPDPVVRAHAAWGLGAIGTPAALDALRACLLEERDETVIAEIEVSLLVRRYRSDTH